MRLMFATVLVAMFSSLDLGANRASAKSGSITSIEYQSTTTAWLFFLFSPPVLRLLSHTPKSPTFFST